MPRDWPAPAGFRHDHRLSQRGSGRCAKRRRARVVPQASSTRSAHLYDPKTSTTFSTKSQRRALGGQELADPAFAFRLAEADGKAVGYAKLGPPELPVEPPRPAIELRQLYVLSDWHGTGAARELMDWVLDEARPRGGDELYLSVFIDNRARARILRPATASSRSGRYAFMVGDQADEDIIMRLAL